MLSVQSIESRVAATKYSTRDRDPIRLRYHTRMRGGLSADQVRDLLTEILIEE